MELSPLPPRPGVRPIRKKGTVSQGFLAMGLISVPVKLVVSHEFMGQPFRNVLIDGLISSVLWFVIAYLMLRSERKKAASR